MADETKTVSCRCMCGAVKFKAELKNTEVGACHCSMCRQWSGGVFLAVGYEGALDFEDEKALGVYRSSDWGERGFCKICGSSLFWRTQDGTTHSAVSAQAVTDLDAPKFNSEIFIDQKPSYYSFAEPTNKMTGAEVFAIFAPKEE